MGLVGNGGGDPANHIKAELAYISTKKTVNLRVGFINACMTR